MSQNANCSYTFATLRIWGRSLDSRRITEKLGVSPSESFQRGDPGGPRGRWNRGYWSLTSRERLDSTDLQAHIEWVLDQIEPVQAELGALLSEPGIRGDIACYWESATDQGGPDFSPAFLRRLAGFNLGFGVSFFYPCSDPNTEEGCDR